jgi:hypothetical protein
MGHALQVLLRDARRRGPQVRGAPQGRIWGVPGAELPAPLRLDRRSAGHDPRLGRSSPCRWRRETRRHHRRRRGDQGVAQGVREGEAGERDPEDRQRAIRGRGVGPPTHVIVAFIDAYRLEFGVEPICRVLRDHNVPIAPSNCNAVCGTSNIGDHCRALPAPCQFPRVQTFEAPRPGPRRWTAGRCSGAVARALARRPPAREPDRDGTSRSLDLGPGEPRGRHAFRHPLDPTPPLLHETAAASSSKQLLSWPEGGREDPAFRARKVMAR